MAFSAPTVTFISVSGGNTAARVTQDVRERLTGQTTGMQNLGTVKDSAGQLATLLYDVSANVIFVTPA